MKCRSEMTVNAFNLHYDSKQCNLGGTFKNNCGKSKNKIVNGGLEKKPCYFCKKENKLLNNHEPYCKKNPNKIQKDNNQRGKPSWNKGLTTETSESVRIGRDKAKETRQENPPKPKEWTDDERKRHSEIMLLAAENHPDSYNGSYNRGFCKSYEYNGVKLIGTWEVAFAKYCDENNIKWIQPRTPFKYEWNGLRSYYPDFYLPEFDMYVEVKGLEKDRDYAKWSVVNNLIVIRQKEIDEIKSKTFNLKDFIEEQ
jgi:hypothetical protein